LATRGNVVSRKSVEAAAQLLRQAPSISAAPESLPALEGELGFVFGHVGALNRVLEYPERLVALDWADIQGLRTVWVPAFANLRKTERFKALMRNFGLVDYWKARGWPDLCRPMGTDDFVCD